MASIGPDVAAELPQHARALVLLASDGHASTSLEAPCLSTFSKQLSAQRVLIPDSACNGSPIASRWSDLDFRTDHNRAAMAFWDFEPTRWNTAQAGG